MLKADTKCSEKRGISIIICCYNSSKMLPKTLRFLREQNVPADLPWEIIVVDNASTDETAEVAVKLWPKDVAIPLKVVAEAKAGLINARIRGMLEAQYDFVSFVDDDNWVEPNWVRIVSEVMTAYPKVGACGGQCIAVFDVEPPFWFEHFQKSYAVGAQSTERGDITWKTGHLWGAGLCLRKSAWDQLAGKDFSFLLNGRKGDILDSGEDYELCYALRLAGWRLWYEPNLKLRHFMHEKRLKWSYLRRIQRGVGRSTLGFDPYIFATYNTPERIKDIAGKKWLWQVFRSCYILIFRNGKELLSSILSISFNGFEGNGALLRFERELARIIELLRTRTRYDDNIRSIENAEWRIYDNPLINLELKKVIKASRTYQFDASLGVNLHQGDIMDEVQINRGIRESAVCVQNPRPLVTVLICNYNYGRYLSAAIQSAMAQTWEPLEIIVVDDGSNDESRLLLERYKDRIHVILKENGGQASAFNAGISAARGEIICFLDSDDFWYPEKVECVVKKFIETPCGLVSHDLHDVDEGGNIIANGTTHSNKNNVHLMRGDLLEPIIKNGFAWMFPPTSGISVIAKIAKKFIPLPEKSWRICADNPVAYAAICHAPVEVLDKVLGAYRHHQNNGFASQRKDQVSKKVINLIIRTERYFYLRDYLVRMGCENFKQEPKDSYRFYRYCCFICREKPWRYLVQLWKRNIRCFHKGNEKDFEWSLLNVARFIIIDTMLSLLMLMGFPHCYSPYRKYYHNNSIKYCSRVKRYLEVD